MAACLWDTKTLVSALLSTPSFTALRSREKRLSSLRGGAAASRTAPSCSAVRAVEERSSLSREETAAWSASAFTSPSRLPSIVNIFNLQLTEGRAMNRLVAVSLVRRQLETSRELRLMAAAARVLG